MSDVFLQRHIASQWQNKSPSPWPALVLTPTATIFRLFQGEAQKKIQQTSLEDILSLLQFLQKGNFSYPAEVQLQFQPFLLNQLGWKLKISKRIKKIIIPSTHLNHSSSTASPTHTQIKLPLALRKSLVKKLFVPHCHDPPEVGFQVKPSGRSRQSLILETPLRLYCQCPKVVKTSG